MPFSSCLMLLLGGAFLAASDPPATPQNLVRQLGHPEFQRRVAAERQLLLLGAESVPAVSQGLLSDDPEVRLRARRLMIFLQRASLQEHEERILANPWDVPEDVVPGWDVYHSLVGDGPAARELYLQILKQETDLMLAVQLAPTGWPIEFERRAADILAFSTRRSDRDVQPATVACLLYLAAHPDNTPSSAAIAVINTLIRDTQFVNAMEHSPSAPAMRSLVSHWIANTRNATPQMRLSIAALFGLPIGIEPARVLIQSRHAAGQSRTQLQNAILFLAKHAGSDAIDELEQLLDDETSLMAVQNRTSNQKDLQVRDVALLGLLTITGQSPEEYGFDGLRQDAAFVYAPNSSSFPNDSVRRRALERWQSWRMTHLRESHHHEDASEGVPL